MCFLSNADFLAQISPKLGVFLLEQSGCNANVAA
jgi:hypothetical protein